jgi:hypothetical protein
MDSKLLSQSLEQNYSSPSLHLDSQILPDVERLMPKIMTSLRGVWVPGLQTKLLNERTREHYIETSEKKYGKSFNEVMEEIGGEEAWMEALPGIHELGEILMASGGPFVMEKHVSSFDLAYQAQKAQYTTASYGDFVIVGGLHFLKVIEEDFYIRVVQIEPAFGSLYDASSEWLQRDDH